MIAFGILASVALIAALMVVASRNPVVSAMWLALTLVAVAGVFVVLGAEFLAVVQLIVYAGAILVFFLFVVMLLNLGALAPGDGHRVQRGLGLYLALALAIVIGLVVDRTEVFGPRLEPAAALAGMGNTEAVATALFSRHLLAFELTAVLLTAAVVGAVRVASRRERD